MNLFITNAYTNPWFFFSWIIIVTFSICVHEYAHAAVALRCGDDTAERAGHLTLNPLVQMGAMSLVLLCAIGIAWGSVPVNPSRFRGRRDAAWVSFAGPLANVVLSFVAAVLALALVRFGGVARVCEMASVANAVLFVLNMLPVPMLDGWSVFALFAPGLERISAEASQQISLFALLVIFLTPLGELVWTLGEKLTACWFSLLGTVL